MLPPTDHQYDLHKYGACSPSHPANRIQMWHMNSSLVSLFKPTVNPDAERPPAAVLREPTKWMNKFKHWVSKSTFLTPQYFLIASLILYQQDQLNLQCH